MKIPSVILLFGAGASYGAGGTNEKPPLSMNLFEQLQAKFPETWGTIDKQYVDKFIPDFEKGMEWLYRNDIQEKYNLSRFLVDLAVFFDRFRIEQANSNQYCRLFKHFIYELKKHKIVTATLNYDCLIEYAFYYIGIKKISYLEYDAPLLLKPHGSCNFIPQNIFVSENAKIILKQSKIETDIKICEPGIVSSQLNYNKMPPAMSLFVSDKTDVIAPSFIREIRTQFANSLDLNSTVISVGVRPNSTDSHIWNPLRNVAKLYIVGKKEDSQDWVLNNNNAKHIGSTFDSAFDLIIDLIKASV